MKNNTVLLIVLAALAALAVVAMMSTTTPTAEVVAATVPSTTIKSGDSATIYRFEVKAEKADVKIKQIYFNVSPSDSIANLNLYDSGHSQLPGVFNYSAGGTTIRYSSGSSSQPVITIPKGVTEIFSLTGDVTSKGMISVCVKDVQSNGPVKGLPAITVFITAQ